MSVVIIREAGEADRPVIRTILEAAFGQPSEAELVERLVADGDAVLELVAERPDGIVGHILFSRLAVETPRGRHTAVALAPLAVAPRLQNQGIGGLLVREAHDRLRLAGETLSVVLGEPAYYGRFGYQRERAAGFESDYQCDALQALAWEDAPAEGRLVYAPAFSAL